MDDEQFERYSRHMLLPQIGGEGQRRLLDSRVMIMGLGGLGAPAAMYLAASGVGQLVLVDYDRVELSNLQRQIIHTTADIGQHKVDSAKETLLALNSDVVVTAISGVLDELDLLSEAARADVVIDASDNFETRFAVNAACAQTQTPLVSGAATGMEGQVSVFHPGRDGSPCYRCLYPDEGDEGEPCSMTGVLAPLLGIIGSVEAVETIKLLLEIGTTLTGRVLVLDALKMQWRTLKLPQDPECPVCAATNEAIAQSHRV